MPNVDRRHFLKLVGAGGVGAGAGFMLAESIKQPVEHLIPYPVPPEEFSPGIATWYNSVCTMCAAGCGISVRTREGRAKKIEGNPAHPVSQGRLCALGQAGLQALYNPDRLTGPLVRTGERGSAAFEPTSWPEGIAAVAERIAALRAGGRGDRVALLSSGVRGHLAALFETFMEQLGSPRLLHHDFNHPQTLYAANARFFGQQSLPYYDIQNTRLLISFGADYLGHWLSPVHHALCFGQSRQGREGLRGHFVQVEPRMSPSGAAADEWIPANPGTEGLLALALARHIVAEGGYGGADRETWRAALDGYTAGAVARRTGVAEATIARLSERFAQTEPRLAIGGGAVGHHSNGLDALVAINALNYLAGNVGAEGGVLFNPAPAFGPVPGSRHASYRAMLELAAHARRGEVEVLIVSGANPLFSLPAAAGFAEALAEIPLVVSLSSFLDETTAMADVVLPSHTYLESWGDDTPEPGVGFRVAAVSQPVVSPLYDTRATGDIILSLARALGLDAAFPWADMREYVREGWRAIYRRGAPDAGGDEGAEAGADDGFDAFWTDVVRAGAWGEEARGEPAAFTPDGAVIDSVGVADPRFAGASGEYPFILHPYLSNALHDGRGANLPWMQELPDAMTSVMYGSWVELNPATADRLGLREGDVVEVASPSGRLAAPVYVYPAIMPDVVAMPIGQGHNEYGRYAKDRGANPIRILAPETEPGTGALAWAATRVSLAATGRRIELVKAGGTSRELGRGIVQTASPAERAAAPSGASGALNSIPVTVVRT